MTRALSRTVRIPWFPDPPCIITIAEAMVQVAMHSQHHRGQCMTRLKDFGRRAQKRRLDHLALEAEAAARWS